MRIAVTADPFIPVPPVNYGGIERIIDFLITGLIQKGHEVKLVAHKDSMVNAPLIKYCNSRSNVIDHISNILTINKLKSWRPHIIHSFSRLAYLLPFLPTNLPKLMSYQREPTLSQIKKAIFLAKHGTLRFTGCSSYISRQIAPYAESLTVYNGVDLNIYKCNSKVAHEAPLVFLGRIEPIKGTDIAIKIAKLTNRKLIIAGNIPNEHKDYFEEKVRPFLNDDISYIGTVNDKQKNELLRNAFAFLMPIRWNEPFGIVMIEALACGTPVIGFNKGAIPEVVKNGVSGFVVSDIVEAAKFIEKIPSIDRFKVREYCETHFSKDIIVNEYEDIYENMVK